VFAKAKMPKCNLGTKEPIDPIMHAVTPAFDATRRKPPRSRSFSNPCYSWSHQPSQILLQGSTVATQDGPAAILPGFGAGSTGTSSSPPILGSLELVMCHEPRDHGRYQRSFSLDPGLQENTYRHSVPLYQSRVLQSCSKAFTEWLEW
jgi:hypothetical protein